MKGLAALKLKICVLCCTLCTASHAHETTLLADTLPSGYQVPQLGAGVGLLDQQNELRIGDKVFREVQRELQVLQDPWLEQQLQEVFAELLAPSQVQRPIGLLLINDSQINAFAAPGGLFALNTGVITTAQNMDEVAGVMAHEIAHVSQRHYSRSQDTFKNQGLLSIAGIIVGAAIAAKASPDAGSAVMLGSQAALLDKQLSYSRNQEREADRIGMQYMAAAGYNPVAMADFFERMHRSRVQLSLMPDFWLTHPLTTERMSEARLRAAQYPKVPHHQAARFNFELIKTYSAMLSNVTTPSKLQLQSQQGNAAAQLTLAAWYSQHGDFAQAQHALHQVHKQLGQSNLYTLIQTDVYLGLKQYDRALQTIASQQRLMPENRAFSLKLAEVYVAQGQTNLALQLLQGLTEQNPRDLSAWGLMQQAMSLKKQDPNQAIQVLRYRAEQQFWSGQEQAAIRSLIHAQRLAKENPVLLSVISQRLQVMQDERANS